MADLKGARVLVTGGNGFLGAFVGSVLEAEGATVMSASRQSGYDLRNEAETLAAFMQAKPTAVVHLATVKGTEKTPARVFRDNLQMGLSVVHASALAKAYLVVLADASLYGNASPEGRAKAAVHGLCDAYRTQHGLRSLFLVSTELYGIGTTPGGIIPFLVGYLDAAEKGKQVTLKGRIEEPRPVLHALDAANAVARACLSEVDQNAPLNLASGEPDLTLGALVEKISARVGYTGKVEYVENGASPISLIGDATKEVLGWTPGIGLEEGLEEAVTWRQSAGAPK